MSKYEEVMGALSAAQLCGVNGATNALQTMRETFGEVDVEQLGEALQWATSTDLNGNTVVPDERYKIIEKAALLVLEFMKEQGNE